MHRTLAIGTHGYAAVLIVSKVKPLVGSRKQLSGPSKPGRFVRTEKRLVDAYGQGSRLLILRKGIAFNRRTTDLQGT